MPEGQESPPITPIARPEARHHQSSSKHIEEIRPSAEDITRIKDLFGPTLEKDIELQKIVEGNQQLYNYEDLITEIARFDGVLAEQYAKYFPSREEFTKQSFALSVPMAIGRLESIGREKDLLDQGYKDPLTGLFNKRYFEEIVSKRLDRAATSGRNVTLMRVDIDNFKSYNDNSELKHEHGDNSIKHVSSILTLNTRGRDEVIRLGGDEFAIVLYGVDEEEGMKLAQRLQAEVNKQEALRKPIKPGQFGEPGSLSIGISSLQGRRISLKELDAEGDTAAYISKESGKARATVFKEGMKIQNQTQESIPA